MNYFEIIGNSSKPTARVTSGGTSVATAKVRVQRSYLGNDGVTEDVFVIRAWKDRANILAAVQEGERIRVCGSVQIRQYEDVDGVRRQAIEVIATEIDRIDVRTEPEDIPPMSEDDCKAQTKDGVVKA